MTSQSCWCFDERADHRPAPPAVSPENRPALDGWPELFAAVLDALLPFRQAYAAALSIVQEVLDQIPGHPLASPP